MKTNEDVCILTKFVDREWNESNIYFQQINGSALSSLFHLIKDKKHKGVGGIHHCCQLYAGNWGKLC